MTNTSDLISREAAIEALGNDPLELTIHDAWAQGRHNQWANDRLALEELPPVSGDGDLISRQEAIDALDCINGTEEVLRSLPSAQPELIEKTAYIRGFEQGRTQGMIDSQGGKK